MTDEERFWSKVDIGEDDECWEWLTGKDGKGYGQFWSEGKNGLAHRAAWRLTRGEIPEGMCICHHCDNPGCVNPDHLFLGTNDDNVADRDRKGRNYWQRLARGEK